MKGSAPNVFTKTLPIPPPTSTLKPEPYTSHDVMPQTPAAPSPASSQDTSSNPPSRSQSQPKIPKVKLKKNKEQCVIVNKEPSPSIDS